MRKKITDAFGKKIYLLGRDQDGYNVYLEEPSWDCDWYWGFGYIETYTNKNRPELSKDVRSHRHWDTFIIGTKEDDRYICHLNENPYFNETVLTDDESWELAELMTSFYTLQKTAELFHRGSSNVSSKIKISLKYKRRAKNINEKLLPKIFKRIDEILSP